MPGEGMKKAFLRTKLGSFFIPPLEGEELQQELHIRSNGYITISHFFCGGDIPYKIIRSVKHIPKPKAQALLFRILAFMKSIGSDPVENGGWSLVLIKGKQTVAERSCPFGKNGKQSHELSLSVRQLLGKPGLWVFDGPDERIDMIAATYTWTSSQTTGEGQENHRIRQSIVLDRGTETLQVIERFGDRVKATHTLFLPGEVVSFLDRTPIHAFSHFPPVPKDAYEPKVEHSTFELTVSTNSKGDRTYTGIYDKDGLPIDWPWFIDAIREMASPFLNEGFFDKALGAKHRRRIGELIFCTVRFRENDRTYSYLTDDERIHPGDVVLVPAGMDNETKQATVVEIEYHDAAHAPYPLEHIKNVIGKEGDT